MNITINELEQVWQILVDDDEGMTNFYKINEALSLNQKVKKVKVKNTYQCPVYYYEYNSVPFVVLCGDFGFETIISVSKTYKYLQVEDLIRNIN